MLTWFFQNSKLKNKTRKGEKSCYTEKLELPTGIELKKDKQKEKEKDAEE